MSNATFVRRWKSWLNTTNVEGVKKRGRRHSPHTYLKADAAKDGGGGFGRRPFNLH